MFIGNMTINNSRKLMKNITQRGKAIEYLQKEIQNIIRKETRILPGLLQG